MKLKKDLKMICAKRKCTKIYKLETNAYNKLKKKLKNFIKKSNNKI